MWGSDQPDLKDRLEYHAFRGLLAAVRAGGPSGSRRFGEALGTFVSRVVPLRRHVALENLQLAFPEKSAAEREEIYRGMCRNLGRVMADFARFPVMTHADILENVTLDGVEHMVALRDGGRGGLLLTGHFGNWERLGAVAPAAGIPVTVLGAKQRNPLAEELFSEYRRATGAESLTLRRGHRALVREFRSKRLVASLADQDGGGDGFFIEFLGRVASVQSGLFRLAARLSLPVMTGFMLREGSGWRAFYQPAMEVREVTGEEPVEREALRLAREYTRRLEALVRAHPDHWFWVHRRWKTRPPGETQPGPADGR